MTESGSPGPGLAALALPSRALHLFLVQRFSSGIASQIQVVAVGWYVYALTNSALDLGLIGLAQFLPIAGLALVAGHIVDRYPRRAIMLGAVTLEFFCYAALAATALSGAHSVAPIFVVAAGLGTVRVFSSPAQSSLLPALVSADAFPRAAAASAVSLQAAVIIGPALGGALFLLGPPVPFLVSACLSALSFTCIALIPVRRAARVATPLTWKSLASGIHFIRGHQAVLGAVSLDLFGVLFGGATALLPIFARDILMIGPVGLGLLRSGPALGAIVTGAILTRWPLRQYIGRRILIAVALFGAATIVFGLSSSVPLSFAALIGVGACDMISVVTRNTLVQTATPDAIRGRVSAVNTLFIGTSNQLGEFESGVTAAWLGPVGSVVLGGAATILIAGLWAWKLPGLRRINRFADAKR
ncbi:MAG TPA: MFS transporter [Stellaceae bacterium]|nr:MFS transporter [Stellaceae bacterium]